MNFCDNCDNLCYIKLDENQEDKLTYYCKNCNNEQLITNDNLIVLKTNFKKNNNNYNIINEYTKLDPTLPRSNNIPCPNENCVCNTENKPNNVIYIRYDDIDLKYIYICTYCDTNWNTNINK
jgi:DNA-directed RNA polymerase subunit M/transcription elongation factor TFIIS